MNNANLSLAPIAEPDFIYGRSIIYTIRRHSAGQSVPEASKVAQASFEKAALASRR